MKTDPFTFSSAGSVGRSDNRSTSNLAENRLRKEQEDIVNWVRRQFENVPAITDLPTAVVVAEPGTTMKVDSYLQVVISGVTYKIALVT